LQIWDVGANSGARKVFGPKLAEAGKALREKEEGRDIIGVVSDDEEDGRDDD
jgi:periodic tryptophan protein 1